MERPTLETPLLFNGYRGLRRSGTLSTGSHFSTNLESTTVCNCMADSLSKEGLNIEEGLLMVKEASDNSGHWDSHNIYIT